MPPRAIRYDGLQSSKHLWGVLGIVTPYRLRFIHIYCRGGACPDRNLSTNTQNRYSHDWKFQQKPSGQLSIANGGVVRRAANWYHHDCRWQSYHNEYAPTLQYLCVKQQFFILLTEPDKHFEVLNMKIIMRRVSMITNTRNHGSDNAIRRCFLD